MESSLTEEASPVRRRITLELSLEKLSHIDALKKEWGLRNRGDVLERLLAELFANVEDELVEAPAGAASGGPGSIRSPTKS